MTLIQILSLPEFSAPAKSSETTRWPWTLSAVVPAFLSEYLCSEGLGGPRRFSDVLLLLGLFFRALDPNLESAYILFNSDPGQCKEEYIKRTAFSFIKSS